MKLLRAAVAVLALFCSPLWAQTFPGQFPPNTIYAGPPSGGIDANPAPRALVQADIDQLFRTGRPWYDVRSFGAVGNGVTDDSTAINAAVTAALVTGGTIFFPNGNYCWNSGGNIAGSIPVQIMGEGLNTEIQTCGADVTLLTLNTIRSYLHDLVLAGPNVLATTHDTISIGSSCVECRLDHLYAVQGRYVINNASLDTAWSYLTLNGSYGAALVYNGIGAGSAQFWGHRLKLDQSWPVSTPARQAAFPARGNTTGYTTGQVVSSGGFLLQATNNGTSGGSPPTLLPYGQNIVDGTVTWKLAARVGMSAVQADTGSAAIVMNEVDMSGTFSYSLLLSNTLAGTGPQNTSVLDSVFAPILGGIRAAAGAGLVVSHSQFSNCITNGCTGILMDTAWAGDAVIAENSFFNNPLAIFASSPGSLNNTAIVGNLIFGSSTAAISLSCNNNINNVNIASNHLGSSTTWGTNAVGILFTGAGTCDNVYGIPTNDFAGATVAVSFASSAVLGNHTDSYPVSGTAVAKAVNFNAGNTDTQIAIPVPPGAIGYLVSEIRIGNASQTLTTATFGLFTAAAGGGTAIQAGGTAITVATATLGSANSAQLTTPGTANTTAYAPATTPLFFRVGTAEGAPATGDVQLKLTWLY